MACQSNRGPLIDCVEFVNKTLEAATTSTTTTPEPLITEFECIYESVSSIGICFKKMKSLLCCCKQGKLWQFRDCNSPSTDCVFLTLPLSAENSQDNETLCCSTTHEGVRLVNLHLSILFSYSEWYRKQVSQS